jgi:hypothetical protein
MEQHPLFCLFGCEAIVAPLAAFVNGKFSLPLELVK